MDDYFSIYHIITCGPKLFSSLNEAKRKAILFLFECSEENSTLLIIFDVTIRKREKRYTFDLHRLYTVI